MSSDDQICCISHLAPPLTPLISARWEDKKGAELLNHLYAINIKGEWDNKTEEKLSHLYERVRSGKRDDVTEAQLQYLFEKVRNSEWSFQMKKLADQLYTKVMNSEWDDVINIYERQKEMIQMAEITPSKQTALHIAISNSLTDVVERLLDKIDALAIREMTDNRKENPLHLAASLGLSEMCKMLVKKDPELIGAENEVGETPLFLAVLNGKKEAFYALHPKCPISGKDIKHAKAHCKRKNGDHILHVSIRGEYFELAYPIIHWYPELINDFNNDGQTALHLLAHNPSAFKRGRYLGCVESFIYSCLIVDSDKLLETPSDFKHCVDIARPVPINYQTCLDLLNLGKRFFKLIVSCARIRKDINSKNVDRLPVKNTISGERQETSNRDPNQDEMSHDSSKHCKRDHIGDKTKPQMGSSRIEEGSGDSTPQAGDEIQMASQKEKEDSTERPQYPSKYNVFHHFLQFAIEHFLLVICLGYFQVGKIKDMKQKHKLAYQTMKKLVGETKLWVSGGTGMKPNTSGAAADNNQPPNVEPDQEEIGQDVSASTSNNPPRPDGFEDGKKWKEMMEPIRKLNDLVEKIVSGLQGKEVFVEAEKKRSDVYRFKMPKDSVEGGKGISPTPILVAAENGVVDIVEEILRKYPLAIYDEDTDKKNVFMLAVENRQLDIYNIFLRKEYCDLSIIFQKSDKDGNSAIHLAATTGPNQPWPIPGAALQMQWELKWYEHVKETMPHNIFTAHRNNEGKTSTEVFNEAHRTMLKEGVKWLTNTAQSCSVVAALVATVAYASATTVPGGVENGIPLLRNTYAFSIFTISSLVALCLSVTSLTMFLSILTSRNEIPDFHHNLPMKLIMGLSSLFISIAAMLVSFCAGHFFDLADRLQHTAFPIYAVTCLPVSIYAVTQFPLYFDLIKSIIIKVPKRNN